jgi:hypothetical protein
MTKVPVSRRTYRCSHTREVKDKEALYYFPSFTIINASKNSGNIKTLNKKELKLSIKETSYICNPNCSKFPFFSHFTTMGAGYI